MAHSPIQPPLGKQQQQHMSLLQ